jgi:hypothetical protein
MTDFNVKAALETLCADRGWDIKPTLCHYLPDACTGSFAIAQWSTVGEDTIKVGGYRISVGLKSLEYGRAVNQEYNLVDPYSLTKIYTIFERIENELKAMHSIWPLFALSDDPWGFIEQLIRKDFRENPSSTLTQRTRDALMEVER